MSPAVRRFGWRGRWRPPWSAVRWLAILLALAAPLTLSASARTTIPRLILAPERGGFGPGCAGRVMALGRGFPEGAGVALYALKEEGAPLRLENILTLLGTVVVEEGRFVDGYVGLDFLLCPERWGGPILAPDGTPRFPPAIPDGARIDIVAAVGTSYDEPWPRHGTELARATFVVDRARPIPATQRCFAATLLCVRDRFHDYWLATGGLARHGFPLTGEIVERLGDGREYTVQYFERSRLEYHPEHAPPDEVQLGQFGRLIRPADPPTAPGPGLTYFPETGQNVGPRFLAYWRANGGLAQFGYPISAALRERLADGREYEVQYFERARLEYHPENGPPYDILLGQFGRQILAGGAR